MVDQPYIAPALEYSVSLRRQITFEAMRVFSGWGYREVQVPLIDYFDTIKRGLDEDAVERSLRFVDHAGNVMMLRTDVTPAIAKVVAYQLDSGGIRPPVRVSYANKIVRIDRGYERGAHESYQLGIELVGVPGLIGELEIMLIALELLDRLGLADYQINVTDHGIARHLINSTGAPSRIRRQVMKAIVARDPHGVRTILRELGIREHYIEALATLADLEGGLHQLARLQETLPDDRTLHDRLDAVRTLFASLSALGYKSRIRIDMAELGGASYYSGLAFNIVSETVGRSLGRGGRYDDLLGRFGGKEPAVGFSLSSESLVELLHPRTFQDSPIERVGGAVKITEEEFVEGFQIAIDRRLADKPARIVTGEEEP